MTPRVIPCVSVVMTLHGPVRVSENTAAALRKKFPNWDRPITVSGFYIQSGDRSEAEKLIIDAAASLAALCNACGQELVEI